MNCVTLQRSPVYRQSEMAVSNILWFAFVCVKNASPYNPILEKDFEYLSSPQPIAEVNLAPPLICYFQRTA